MRTLKKTNDSWLKWSGLFFVATFLGFFFASQSYLSYIYRNYEANFLASLSFTLPDWYIWALLTPVIVWLARRFPLERQHWLRSLSVHLLAGVFITILKLFLVLAVGKLISWLPERSVSIYQFHPNFVTYWVVVGLSHAFQYYRKFRERELRASQLETRLAQAQLQVLKMQLQPHFLFNTLHAISSLMHKDVDAADRMMARLSDLLRLTLENVGVQEVSLKQELEFLQGYLEIEQTRFKDRLTIHTDIDPQTLDARVPNLILQPLVENAIRHGIEPYKEPGTVEIMARREDGTLRVSIRDSGPGLSSAKRSQHREGIGIANTKARLKQLYGEDFGFELCESNSKGFIVKLTIPFLSENHTPQNIEKASYE